MKHVVDFAVCDDTLVNTTVNGNKVSRWRQIYNPSLYELEILKPLILPFPRYPQTDYSEFFNSHKR